MGPAFQVRPTGLLEITRNTLPRSKCLAWETRDVLSGHRERNVVSPGPRLPTLAPWRFLACEETPPIPGLKPAFSDDFIPRPEGRGFLRCAAAQHLMRVRSGRKSEFPQIGQKTECSEYRWCARRGKAAECIPKLWGGLKSKSNRRSFCLALRVFRMTTRVGRDARRVESCADTKTAGWGSCFPTSANVGQIHSTRLTKFGVAQDRLWGTHSSCADTKTAGWGAVGVIRRGGLRLG